MTINKILIQAAILLVGSFASALISSETKNLANSIGATELTEIKFTESSTGLTADQKKEIDQVIANARSKGNIEEVKIMAWADKEYPMNQEKYSSQDIEIANKRLNAIQNYVKKQLKVSDVDVYNMAERPNKLEELFKTTDARVKQKAEAGGAAPKEADNKGWFNLKGQASKALVMVVPKE